MDPFESFYGRHEDEAEEEIIADSEFDSDEYKLIGYDQAPPNGKWKLPIMYKVGARGENRYYQVGFDEANVVSIWGQVGGTSQTSRNKVELNTRSKDLKSQAKITACFLYRKYYKKNFREKGSRVPIVKQPMLGHPLKDAKNLTFPVALEVKLNGVRGLFEEVESTIKIRSRGGKYYTQFDNICKYMKEFLMYFPPGTILDAEIYMHGMKLEDISGTARTINVRKEEADEMIAYIFDAVLPEDPVYEDRKKKLNRSFRKYIREYKYDPEEIPIEILQYEIANSMDDIYEFHYKALEAGYEGTVVKRMSAGCKNKTMCQYKGGKSGRFYKLKEVLDEEGIIVEVLNCTGKEEGCARFTVLDPRGNLVNIRPKGDYDHRRELYNRKEELIGQLYTYEYSSLSKYGVPEHPRGVAVRHDLDTENVIKGIRKKIALSGNCVCEYFTEECECKKLSVKNKKIN